MWSSGLLILLTFFTDLEAQIECWEDYECKLQTITTSTSNIECYGYYSCTNGVLIESTSSGYIECYGSYSCYNSDVIQHTGTDYALIYCMLFYMHVSSYTINN